MIRVTVFNRKSLYKFFFIIILFCILLVLLTVLYNNKDNINFLVANNFLNFNNFFSKCLDQTIPEIKLANSDKASSESSGILETILYSELPIMNKKALISANVVNENLEEDDEVIASPEVPKTEIQFAATNLPTEVIPNGVSNTYTNDFSNVKIKNRTDYTLNYEALDPNSLKINKSNIIIFHTHTCESYTQSTAYAYEASGHYRTTNLACSVSRVGDELSKYLLSYGYNVIHDTTYHDYPSYSGSYGRSMGTVQNILASTPDTDIIIDIHRNAIEDTSYAPSVKIGDEVVSQLMFVIGTDAGGLSHPNWQDNLKFAIKVQQKANELYPGLFLPIMLTTSRYNQQLGKAACIIEVGATGNTLDQSILSMKYLSKILDEIIKAC